MWKIINIKIRHWIFFSCIKNPHLFTFRDSSAFLNYFSNHFLLVLFLRFWWCTKNKKTEAHLPVNRHIFCCRLNLCLCVLSSTQDLSQCVTCKEKHITVKKEPHESLGMTVAGGRGSKSGELPIFVTSVQPHGCLSRDGRIKRGERSLGGDSDRANSARSKTSETTAHPSSLLQGTCCWASTGRTWRTWATVRLWAPSRPALPRPQSSCGCWRSAWWRRTTTTSCCLTHTTVTLMPTGPPRGSCGWAYLGDTSLLMLPYFFICLSLSTFNRFEKILRFTIVVFFFKDEAASLLLWGCSLSILSVQPFLTLLSVLFLQLPAQ